MNRLYLPFLFLTLAAGSAHAGADFCAKLVKAPTITLEMSKPVRQYRHDQTIDQLTAQAKASGTPVEEGGLVTGLTTDSHHVEVKSWWSVAQVPDGFCVSPQSLVRIKDRQVIVALPKEVPGNSCFFQATLEHEHKHVRVLEVDMEQMMQEEVSRMEREFRGQYGYFQNLQNAQARIDQLRASVERRVLQTLDRVEQKSGGIDTPQEYTRVQSVCKDRPEAKKAWWKVWG